MTQNLKKRRPFLLVNETVSWLSPYWYALDFWKIELRKIDLNELHFWSNSNLTFTICTLTQTQTNNLKIKETVKKRSLFLFHDATFQQDHWWNSFHKWTSKGYGNMGCQFSYFFLKIQGNHIMYAKSLKLGQHFRN